MRSSFCSKLINQAQNVQFFVVCFSNRQKGKVDCGKLLFSLSWKKVMILGVMYKKTRANNDCDVWWFVNFTVSWLSVYSWRSKLFLPLRYNCGFAAISVVRDSGKKRCINWMESHQRYQKNIALVSTAIVCANVSSW